MIPVHGTRRNRHAVNTLFFTGNKTEHEGTGEKKIDWNFHFAVLLNFYQRITCLSIAPK